MPKVPLVVGGDCISRVILPARSRPKSHITLAKQLGPVIAAWISSAVEWPDLGLGQSRVLVFETPLPGGATFFVRFWSEPDAPLLCEVPSGIQDDALRAVLLGSATGWAERNGLVISGKAQNYRGQMRVGTTLLIDATAAIVVKAFVESIGYAGHTPLAATLAHHDRRGLTSTVDSFTEEEMARVFASFGFEVTPSHSSPNDGIDEPEFICSKDEITTVIAMMDPVPDHRLYRRVRFDADLPITELDIERSRRRGEAVTDDMTTVAISGIHAFTGGVTPEWLVERVRDWDNMLQEHRREAPRKRSRGPRTGSPSGTVH